MVSDQYLAGLFDGEGSFSIQVGMRSYQADRPSVYFNPSMSMHLHYGVQVLEELQGRFGGAIYPHAKGGARWNLGRRAEVMAAAAALRPHLIIKADIADRFMEALALFPVRGGAAQRHGGRVWSPEIAVRVAEIALDLNPPRSRKTNKTAEYVQILREQLERSVA